MSLPSRVLAASALALTLSSCASLIPDQQKDYLGLGKRSLSGTLTPAPTPLALAPLASSSWTGTVTYSGTFGDISGLPADPTNLVIPLGFASGTLSSACGSASGISLTVSSWSVKVSDASNPTGVSKSSNTPLTYNATLSGTNLALVASGAGTAQVQADFASLKPILTTGGTNTVTASANVTLTGCSLDGSSVALTLTTPDLQQTLSFK